MMPMPRTRLCTHLSGSAREVEERIRNLFRRHRRPPALRRCGQLAAPMLTGAVRPVILLPDPPPGGAALQYGLLRPDCPFWEGRHATAADGRLNIWSADGGPEARISLS